MTWNYRLIEHVEGTPDDPQIVIGLHEVHCDESGVPKQYTERPAAVADSHAEMFDVMGMMNQALFRPVLKASDFND